MPYLASEEASLRALESLMTEFFHSCTTNDRKREIGEHIVFTTWRQQQYYSKNKSSSFFNLVNKMWVGVASEDKAELRSCLPKLLLSQHALLPFFIRNKLCKVIVDIGRQDWPMFYHNFFSNTLQLVQSPSLAPLGLVLLKMTSEELVCPREDLSVARKEELKKLLLDQIPTVLNLLTVYVNQPIKTKPLPTSNGDSAPRSLPANGGGGGHGRTGQMVGHAERAKLGVMAMNCINELMCKNCVPVDFEEFLLRMFQQTFYLLQRLTNTHTNTHTIKSRLQELDESYVEKFTDFLRLFVSVHLRRIESNAQFPLVEFLALLLKYTFNQPNHEGYLACLDIWSIFLDYLTTKIRSRLADSDSVINRYKDALVLLLREVLNRIQFRLNQSQLEELDDETLDDDQQTEWQRFLRQSLEVVARVMELLPSQTFSVLFPVLQEDLDIYLGLQQFIMRSGTTGRRLNITAEADCRKLHCALRDLSSLLQAVGRLAEFFTGDVFSARFNDALAIVQRLVEVSCYGSQISLYDVEMAVPSVLKPDLIDVHAQSLAALQAYSHWLAPFCGEVQRQQEQTQFVDLIRSSMAATTPLINAKVPEKLLLSACHLLVSMATTVRPVFLVSLPAAQNIFSLITENHNHRLPQEAHVLVCRALSNMLLLPWPSLPEAEQQWQSRSANHTRLLSSLTQQYRLLPRPPSHHPNSKAQTQFYPLALPLSPTPPFRRSCPDVKAEMFELLFQILHQNWRFFFKSSVLSSVQRTGAEELMENQAQFIAAMQAFGQSFLQPDIHIFKQNLSYLEVLNTKHKLYHRKLFRNTMLFHFINVLLQVLLHKSHDLLQDDITLALYNMAAVDFPAFYSSFLPEFLNGCQGLDPHQRTTLARNFTPERDLPSFSQGVYRIVNDLRFYRLCNGSLPPGTLKL
uniref:Exportin-6-like n=1 Tax=Sinocyclocheilus grahami TaxID=75366 RepID=A0A672QHV0_SINGR